MSKDSSSATSSPGSAAGHSRSISRDGAVPAGPAAFPVSRFRSQANTKAMPTNDTSGPLFTHSSISANLQRSLENRLRQRLDVNGSPEYALIWKTVDMPSGVPISRLRASERRTFVSACGGPLRGWTTPQGHDAKGMRGAGQKIKHGTKHGCADLSREVLMAGWATPTVQDAENRAGPSQWVRHSKPLNVEAVAYGGTPSSSAPTARHAELNPLFTLWLMLGPFAIEWARCAAQATRSVRRSRQSS